METVVNISDKLYKYMHSNKFDDIYANFHTRIRMASKEFNIPRNKVYRYAKIGDFMRAYPVARVSIRANHFENDMEMLDKLANSGEGWLFRMRRILNPEIDKFDNGERGVQYNVVDFLKHKGFNVYEYVSIPHGMQADILAENVNSKLIVEVKAKSDAGSIREAVGQCKYCAHVIKSATGVEYYPYIAAPSYPIDENYTLTEWVAREGVILLTTPLDWDSCYFKYDRSTKR
jgi:hypothetical protein